MSIARKIAIAAGAATLAAGGVAGAVVVPDAADGGLSTAEEKVGQELPASKDSHPTKDQHPGVTAAGDDLEEGLEVEEPEAPEAPEDEDGEEEGGPVGNHGAEVSAVAHATESGPGKGAIVSEVARSDAGKVDHPEGDDEADDEGDDEGGDEEG
jgi:hypothetical protein